jgi:hypothetical protein
VVSWRRFETGGHHFCAAILLLKQKKSELGPPRERRKSGKICDEGHRRSVHTKMAGMISDILKFLCCPDDGSEVTLNAIVRN